MQFRPQLPFEHIYIHYAETVFSVDPTLQQRLVGSGGMRSGSGMFYIRGRPSTAIGCGMKP
jgi:hypothetical protein